MIPYTDESAHIADDYCTARRLEQTLKFIRGGDMQGEVYDIGEPNYVGRKIREKHDNAWYHNVEGFDLNQWHDQPDASADVVLMLEVFEHVMNPALVVTRVAELLGAGGVLYLSTPVRNPYGFMFNETNHFNEYSVKSVCTCLRYCGFTVTDVRTFKSIPFWQGIRRGGGVFRTLLRVMSQETMLIRAVK